MSNVAGLHRRLEYLERSAKKRGIGQPQDKGLPTRFYDESGQLLSETPAARRCLLLPCKEYFNMPDDDGVEEL